jgi:hypothetical protein
MAAIGLAEAARLTGRNRSTIHRAMRTGRLSFSKTADGERRVEVTELERVFGIKAADIGEGGGAGNGVRRRLRHSAQPAEVAALHLVIERQDATIADLRATIRAITDEKRALLGMLTDRRPWWRRGFQ